jgi:hypothetical protein
MSLISFSMLLFFLFSLSPLVLIVTFALFFTHHILHFSSLFLILFYLFSLSLW